MKDFDWRKFKAGEIAVHCDTLDKAKDFVKECIKRNILWASKAETETLWEEFKEDTFYFCSITLSRAKLLYGNSENVEYEEIFEWEISSCPKLKDGMIVEIRNGRKYLLRTVCGELIGSNFDGWIELTCDENLCENKYNNKDFDVMKIYESHFCLLDGVFNESNLSLIWEREEVEEMTLEEICNALGKKIKIKED